MTQECFQAQMTRLRETYGERAYPPERVKLIFAALRTVPDHRFEKIVDGLIANYRAAPMLKEFIAEEQDEKKRENDAKQFGSGSYLELLREAEKNNTRARPEIVKACMELILKRMSGKITHEQFLQGGGWIDDAVGVKRKI